MIFVSPVCVFLYGPHNFDTRAKRAFPVWQNNVGLTPRPLSCNCRPLAAEAITKKGEQVLARCGTFWSNPCIRCVFVIVCIT